MSESMPMPIEQQESYLRTLEATNQDLKYEGDSISREVLKSLPVVTDAMTLDLKVAVQREINKILVNAINEGKVDPIEDEDEEDKPKQMFGKFNGPIIDVWMRDKDKPVWLDIDGVDIHSGTRYQLRDEHLKRLANFYKDRWRDSFRTIGEMDQGDPEMIIEGVLQAESTCFFGALPGHGKTLVALAFAKAICTGTPLFNMEDYKVPVKHPVLYLIPESSDRAFRRRCEAFRIPDNEYFMARTISSGIPLKLQSPELVEAVRKMRPVIILDTMRRFTDSTDENQAAQNKQLFNDVLSLRAYGAIAVIIIHHATKGSKTEAMTLENMLSGTGDIGATPDHAYGIRMDEHLYSGGQGPMEIEIKSLKDRENYHGLTRLNLAASKKVDGRAMPVSVINETGNFAVVDLKQNIARERSVVAQLVIDKPQISLNELSDMTGFTKYKVNRLLAEQGYHTKKGGPTGRSDWHKDVDGVCPYAKANRKGIDLDRAPRKDKVKSVSAGAGSVPTTDPAF